MNLWKLLGGRKNSLTVLAVIVVAVIHGLGEIDADRFSELLVILTGIGVGGHALEDGLGKVGKGAPDA